MKSIINVCPYKKFQYDDLINFPYGVSLKFFWIVIPIYYIIFSCPSLTVSTMLGTCVKHSGASLVLPLNILWFGSINPESCFCFGVIKSDLCQKMRCSRDKDLSIQMKVLLLNAVKFITASKEEDTVEIVQDILKYVFEPCWFQAREDKASYG